MHRLSVEQVSPVGLPKPSFDAVFEQHFAYVTTVLGRLGVRKRDLADVAHEVFLQVFRNLELYDPTRPMRPWLFGISYRAASNYRRKAQHRLELVDNPLDPCDGAPGAEQRIIEAEQRALLEAALREVEMERRAVLILCEIEGYRITEIAKILGLPLNTAYSRLRLARREFKAVVDRLRAREATRWTR